LFALYRPSHFFPAESNNFIAKSVGIFFLFSKTSAIGFAFSTPICHLSTLRNEQLCMEIDHVIAALEK